MSLKNIADLTTDKNVALADNTSGDITPIVSRNQQQDLIDSMLNKAAGNPEQIILGDIDFQGGIKINGSGLYGSEYQLNEVLGDSINSTVTPLIRSTITIPDAAPTGTYLVDFSCLFASSSNGRQCVFQLFLNAGGILLSSVEPMATTSDRRTYSRVWRVSHTNGGGDSVLELKFNRGSQATTITVNRSLMQVWRVL